jgi:type IV pilus assembly protein PilE
MVSPCGRARSAHRQRRGFTLIELMIAIVVVGILTAIALPQYNEFVRRSRITEALNGMNDYRTRMEQFFQDNRQYNNGAACGAVLPPTDAFAITCVVAGAAPNLGYTLTATGQAAKGMTSFVYTLNVNPATGAVTRASPTLPGGWTTSANCWVIRKNGSCS